MDNAKIKNFVHFVVKDWFNERQRTQQEIKDYFKTNFDLTLCLEVVENRWSATIYDGSDLAFFGKNPNYPQASFNAFVDWLKND